MSEPIILYDFHGSPCARRVRIVMLEKGLSWETRLVDLTRMQWQNRAQFFAIAARLMRTVLVDAARGKRAAKRGGSALRVTFDEARTPLAHQDHNLLALDDALDALAREDPRKCQVVELRFFGGLSNEEVAEVLAVSTDTVTRDWKFAKAWLRQQLAP